MGWFVVSEDDPRSGASEQATPADEADRLIAKYAGQGPPPAMPIKLQGPLPAISGGTLDFPAVYAAAGVGATEQGLVVKAQDLLRSLPAETPVPLKRQIVEASLKAFGLPTEQIIEAGVAEMQALEAYLRTGQAETQRLLTEASSRISSLEAEIASVRNVMEETVTEQQARERAVNGQKLTIQDVLEFFGQEAVAKVVEASPKLHTPTDA